MLLSTFGELSEGTKFTYKHCRYIKIPTTMHKIISCCNFDTTTIVNAKSEDESYVFFSPNEQVVIRT